MDGVLMGIWSALLSNKVWWMDLMYILLLNWEVEVIDNLKKAFLKSDKYSTLLMGKQINPNILLDIVMKFAAKQIVNFDTNR